MRDLWERELPEFDGYTIDAKYQVLHGQDFDADQQRAWQAVVDVCDEFKSADKYLFSLPMWNFGIPYKLKHYIDVIAQPGQTFSFDPATGYSGLVAGKPAAVVYARGGAYSSDQAKGPDSKTLWGGGVEPGRSLCPQRSLKRPAGPCTHPRGTRPRTARSCPGTLRGSAARPR